MVQLALDYGANVNYNPLYRQGGHWMEDWATTKSRDENFRPALFYAIRNDNCEMAQLLLSKGAYVRENYVYVAAVRKNLRMLELLLSAGGDSNDVGGNYKASALIEASSYGTNEMVTYLIERGANVNQTDNSGMTPLMNIAMYPGNTGNLQEYLVIAKTLLNNGANPNIRGGQYKKQTALEMAVETRFDELVVLLLPLTKI